MDHEAKEKYIEAGEAIQKARQKARKIAESGTNFETIAEEIEAVVRDEGLKPAFPVNLSRNNEAAHYTPSKEDDKVLEESDVLKVDIGAHSDGYIADTALTVNPSGENQEMIEKVETVLEKALEFLEPGITVGEFGTYVEKQVPKDLQVVRNLTGHYLGQYKQHAGISIPNVSNANNHVFEAGDAVAIEPFLTDGSGKVKEGGKGNIYKIEASRNVRGRSQRKLLNQIQEFKGLPFTTRWISDFGGRKRMAMKKLVDHNIVHSYPILKELNGGTVVQAEHTVLIQEDENIVTTRP